jgi:hypothetical protein
MLMQNVSPNGMNKQRGQDKNLFGFWGWDGSKCWAVVLKWIAFLAYVDVV